MSNFTKIKSYAWNFQNFSYVIIILVKFDIHVLGLPIFFGVTAQFPGGFRLNI